MRNRDGTHIWPGGRRERGERPQRTLDREVLEETGWKLSRASLVGFLHFHHLSPKPLGYAYPYPDFVQPVYAAVARQFDAKSLLPGEHRSEFVDAGWALGVTDPAQRPLLRAALEAAGLQRTT